MQVWKLVVLVMLLPVSLAHSHPIVVGSEKTQISPEFLWVSLSDTAWESFFQPKNFSDFQGKWIWLRLQIDNRTQITDFYLSLKTSEVQLIEKGQILQRAGTFIPLSGRSNPLDRFALKLKLTPAGSDFVYLKLKAEKNFEKKIVLQSLDYVESKETVSQIEMAFLQGVLWVMVLYNLIVFFSVRQVSYLHYSLLFAVNAIYFLASEFLLAPLLGVEFPYFDSYVNNYFSVFYFMAFVFFSISYLNTSKNHPGFHKILLALVLICVGLLVNFTLNFGFRTFDYDAISSAIFIANVVKLPIIGFGIYFSGYLLIDSDKLARYYAYANLVLFCCGIIFLLGEDYLGFIPSNPVTDRILQLGVVFQALMFSRALAAKITATEEQARLQNLENERIKAQQAIEIAQVIEQKNIQLEHQVIQRTRELTHTNTLLEENQEELHLTIAKLDQTNKSLENSLVELDSKNKIIEHSNRNLMSSISYGSRIQRALLPPYKLFGQYFEDSFIFYLPRDVVSGDFYWLQEKNGIIYLAAMDCTGHGVPGAFMSLIGHSIFNQVFFSSQTTDIAEMLRLLNEGVIQSLQKETSKNSDGIDIAVCAVDKAKKTIEFAGAKGQGLFVLDGQDILVRGDRFSIGDRADKFEKQFFSYQKYAYIYLFSDGFQHQFGGPNSRKFMLKPMINLLLENHQLPMFKQMEKLGTALQNWMEEGKEKQIDDIMVLGVRV